MQYGGLGAAPPASCDPANSTGRAKRVPVPCWHGSKACLYIKREPWENSIYKEINWSAWLHMAVHCYFLHTIAFSAISLLQFVFHLILLPQVRRINYEKIFRFSTAFLATLHFASLHSVFLLHVIANGLKIFMLIK